MYSSLHLLRSGQGYLVQGLQSFERSEAYRGKSGSYIVRLGHKKFKGGVEEMAEYTVEQLEENRTKWLGALRSGEYKQADGYLKIDGKFCCLGVACEISGLGEWIEESPLAPKASSYNIEGENPVNSVLPETVRGWLGLESVEGAILNGEGFSLTYRNDNGYSFEKIADIIESTPTGLFKES